MAEAAEAGLTAKAAAVDWSKSMYERTERIMAEMQVYSPGGKQVYADCGGFTIQTDQPARSGSVGDREGAEKPR